MDQFYLCKRSGETVDHLLLLCEVAEVVWNEVFSRTRLVWAIPERVVDLFASWRGLKGNHQIAAMWNIIPMSLMWVIWMEKNGQSFED